MKILKMTALALALSALPVFAETPQPAEPAAAQPAAPAEPAKPEQPAANPPQASSSAQPSQNGAGQQAAPAAQPAARASSQPQAAPAAQVKCPAVQPVTCPDQAKDQKKEQKRNQKPSKPQPSRGATHVRDQKRFDQRYLNSGDINELSDSENKTMQKVDDWRYNQEKSIQNTQVRGDGTVVFSYGSQAVSVLCSPLNLTDIEFEPGEQISSVNLGDPSRWTVSAAVTGSGESSVQHVIVKPLDVGLNTTMMVATDRRGYRLRLKSLGTNFFPHVAFSYPEQIALQFEARQKAEAEKRDRESITVDRDSGVKTYLGDLNFNYKTEGDVSWKPVRVYDDGKKTIIEMPETMRSRSAPSLLLLRDPGGWFSDEVTELINYRIDGNRYIVDGLFETAILTMDLDSRQQRVVITRLGDKE